MKQTHRCSYSPPVLECWKPRLHRNQYSSNEHHTCPKQPLPEVAFPQEELCPQDGEDGAQLEEGSNISDEAKRNRREAKEGRQCLL
jgi:hypothetical protein